jgi:hypothetical protein
MAPLGSGQTVKAKKRKVTRVELARYGITGLTVMLGIELCLDLHRLGSASNG